MSQNISQRLCFYPNQNDNFHFISYPLAPGETLIGSGPNCTIFLGYPNISAEHCKLTISQEGLIKIKALDTEHGVYRATPSNPEKLIPNTRYIVHLPDSPFYLSKLYKCVIENIPHAPPHSNSPKNGALAPAHNLHNGAAEPENDSGNHLGLSSEVRETLLLSEADEEHHQHTLSENAGDDLDPNSNREYFTNSMAQHLETEDGQNTLVFPEDEEDPDSYNTPQSKNMSRFPESAESGKTQLMSTVGEEGQGTAALADRGYPTPQSRSTPVTNNEKSKNSSQQVIPQEERGVVELPPTLLLSDEEEDEEAVRIGAGENHEKGVTMEEEVVVEKSPGKGFKAPENKSQTPRGVRGMEEENPEKIEENLPTQVLTMSMTEDQEPPTQTLPESTQEHGHEENDPIKLSEYDKDNATTFMLYPSQKTEMDIVSAATVPKDEDLQTQLIPQNQSQRTVLLPSSGLQENNNSSGLGTTTSKERIERSTTLPIDLDDDEEEENEDAMEEEFDQEHEEEIRSTVAMEERDSVGDPDRLQDTLTLQASQGLSQQQHHEDEEDQEEEIPKLELTSDRAKATTLRDTVRDNELSIRGASTPVDDSRSFISGYENKSEATTTSGNRAEAPTQRDHNSIREASTPKDEYRSLTSGGRGQARTLIDSLEGPKEEDRRTRSDRSERRDPPTQSEMMEPPSQESTGQIIRAKKEQINEITKKMTLVGIKPPVMLRELFGLQSPPPEQKEEAKSNRNSNRNNVSQQPQYQTMNETQIFSPTQNTINNSQMSEAEVNITIKTYEGFSDTTSQKVKFKGRGPKIYEASEGYLEEDVKIQQKKATAAETDTNRDWVISDWLEDDNKRQKQEEREAEKESTVRKKGRGRSNTTGKKKAPAKSLDTDEDGEEEEYNNYHNDSDDDEIEPKRKRAHQDRRKSEPKKKTNKVESKPKTQAKAKPKAQPKKTVAKNSKKGKTKKPWDEEDDEEEEYQLEEEILEEEKDFQPKVVRQRGRKNTKTIANIKMEEEEEPEPEPMKERKGFLLIPPRRIMTRASSKDIPVSPLNDRKDSLESENNEVKTTKKKVNTKKMEKKEEKIETIVTKKEAVVGRRKPQRATQLEEYEEEEEQPQPKRRGRNTTMKKSEEDIQVTNTLQKKKEEPKSKGKKTTSKGKKKKRETEIKTETYDSLEEVELSDYELIKRNSFKVMFTGFGKEDHKKVERAKDDLSSLGIKVVEESAQNFNLLIMDKFKRTIKFLLAINRGIDIVSYKWIQDCLDEEDIMEPKDYIFSDRKAELKYKFKLEKSLKTAKDRTNGFLDEYRIFLPGNIKPSLDEVKMLIESADGQVVKSRPQNFQDDLIVVVNDDDDKNIVYFKDLGYTPYSTELIYSGVLHQKLDLKLYKL